MRKRMKFAVLAGSIAALAMMAASPAVAGLNGPSSAPDPQTTNVPYLAWAGNSVRIAKCIGDREMDDHLRLSADQRATLLTPGLLLRAKFRIEDWSGLEPNATGSGYRNVASKEPQFLNDQDGDTVAYLDSYGRLCFSVTVSSLKPGLAVIKGAARIDLAGFTPGFDILGMHQFVVIWLRSQAPIIREVANADFPSIDLGDPAGDGIFNPFPTGAAYRNGLVEIRVAGNFPLGNDFSGIDPDNIVNLPADWAWLASKFAVDDYAADGGVPGRASMRWDIHDDQGTRSDHAGANSCTPKAGTVEAVDNCTGGGERGPFSHYYGFSSDWTVGPFDPLRAEDTLLSDNALNADDAPMPALRVDVRIAAGGIGSLEKADKDNIYVRDRTKPDNTPHNLYAPFYEAYIPAAGPSLLNSDRSGVAGSFVSNNFPGYQNSGRYDFYDIVGRWTEDPTRNSRTVVCRDELGNPRPNISGPDHVAVYTDEHGMAFVAFNPNSGFRWTADSNGRCPLTPGSLGTANITAEAIYPDQPVLWDQVAKVSNSLTKTVNSLASKTLACVPKGANEMFCVETIRGIDGRPVAGAKVEFSRTPLGPIFADSALHGGFDTRGQTVVSSGSALGGPVVLLTGANGQAGVLVRETLPGQCVDVSAENVGTRNPNSGVFVSLNIVPSAGRVGCGTTTTGGGTGGGSTGGGSTGGGSTGGGSPTGGSGGASTGGVQPAASIVSLAGNPVPAVQTPAAKTGAVKVKANAKVAAARLLVLKGNRFLQLRVNSNLAKAKVRIVLMGKNGKATRVVTRTIATNRLVVVGNLKFSKAIKSVRVSLVV
jgi:hypothetical protein